MLYEIWQERNLTPAMIFALVYLVNLAYAVSDSPAEGWNDFTNNFASDIAPLISLFGEQATKQFLSESTRFLDNVIFGMAPIGILTAVVSAIRVYGSPGLKAFIGRAQESHGLAEAELCSSTSDDVCELWSEGGICRVFGRPKVLEFFHKTKKDDFYPDLKEEVTEKDLEKPGACNIYQPACFLAGKHCCQNGSDGNNLTCDQKDDDWVEDKPDLATDNRRIGACFAQYPNLSLNIGIREISPRGLGVVAILATLLQLSFFVYAVFITFYSDKLYNKGELPDVWAFVLVVIGTIMIVFGMILCSFLIERRSKERHFRVAKSKSNNKEPEHHTTIYWLQPGNQLVGDQKFNAFSYSSQNDRYITSWKRDRSEVQLDPILGIAIFSSIVGFVLQFIGFRGVHGSIALYQIAATLIMAIVRASLRRRGLDPANNDIQQSNSETGGHELDWQAMEIAKSYKDMADTPGERIKWRMLDLGFSPDEADKVLFEMKHKNISICIKRGGQANEEPKDNGRVASLVGFDASDANTNQSPDRWLDARNAIKFAKDQEKSESNPNLIALIPLIRARLAYLTSGSIVGVQPKWDSLAKTTALELQVAIQDLTEYIFSGRITLS